MKALRRFARRLTATLFGRDEDERVREELAEHLTMLTEEHIAAGLSPDEARRHAARKLGAFEASAEACRDERRLRGLEQLGADLRIGIRSIRRYPLAVGVAVLSLAVGIGATAVTLAARDVIFRKFPPLYHEPQQLSRVQVDRADRPLLPAGSAVPADLFRIWAETPGLDIAASVSRGTRDVRAGDRTELVAIRDVTANVFDLLGVRPSSGRGFAGDAGDASAAVLSHAAAGRLFGSSGGAIGQIVWIDGRPLTIVGVMPERFWLADMSSPVWVTMDTRALPAETMLDVVVRRAAAVTSAGLDAQLGPGLADYVRGLPDAAPRLRTRISGLEGTPTGRQLSIVLPYVLAVAVLLTLLIACANVAVLMIAQWTGRDREIAIRASIGASRRRIVQQLLTESMLIAVSGAVLGVGAALAFRGLLRNSDGAALFDLSIDPAIFLKITLVTLVAGVATGLLPALHETRRLHVNPLAALRRVDRVRQRLRHGLVVFEIAVTVALLVVTTTMIDGYRRARDADLGFDTGRLMTARVESPAGVPADEVLRVVGGLPGVAAAAASTSVPFGMAGAQVAVSATGDAVPAVEVEQAVVRGPFFVAMGVPMVAGRDFEDRDIPSARTAVINEALARRLFPEGRVLGATVWIASVPHDVIGIARDYASNPFRATADEPRVFVLLEGDRAGERLQLVVRTANDPAPLVPLLRREVVRGVPGIGVSSAVTFPQVMSVMGQEMMVATAPLVPLIAIATLLTLAGIYGVLAFAVSRRSRELAVRLAVGAAPRHLAWGITRSTFRLVAAGAGIGIGLTYGLSRLVRAGGGAGSIYDPAWHAFAVPLVAIGAIGLAATWLPARRAAAVDSVTLLRAE